MRKIFFLLIMFLSVNSVLAITPATNPSVQADKVFLDKYLPNPVGWSSMTPVQQQNYKIWQLKYLCQQLIQQGFNSTSTAPDLSNYMQFKGSTHISLMDADKKNTNAIATIGVEQKFSEKYLLMATGKTDAEISVFMALDPIKDVEKRQKVLSDAWKKLAEKPTINWSSPEAQTAIKSWAEINLLGGQKLEDIMGIDPATGKVRNNVLPLLVFREDLDKTNLELTGTQTKVSDLSTAVINNALDIAQLQECIVWIDATDVQGKPCKVPRAIQWDMMPEQVKDAIAKMPTDKNGIVLQAASQEDLKKKADQAELTRVEGKVDRLQKQVDGLIAVIVAFGLNENDKGLVELYAIFSQGGNLEGFKAKLKKLGEEKKFDKIQKAAKEAAKKGFIKLDP